MRERNSDGRRVRITRPDDWHVHLRDGDALGRTVADSARYNGRILVMPNLEPPLVRIGAVRAYRERVLGVLEGVGAAHCTPLMALYLSADTGREDIRAAAQDAGVLAAKLYPAGVTTHSGAGPRRLEEVYPLLEEMQRHRLPLCVHGETPDPEVDVFDRERIFVERELAALVRDFPELRIVLEHISTREAVDFVRAAPPTVAATITAHHLLYNRNALLAGGLRPHMYCAPILKKEPHRQAVLEAALSGQPCFFLGSDSAPHARITKESACGCAGIYTAHAALECYAEVFDGAQSLERLEAFASHHGADFYGLPRNPDTIQLHQVHWQVPASLPLGSADLVPARAGENIAWVVVG